MLRYQDHRLSKHFTMLDFIYGPPVVRARCPFPFESSLTSENLRNGRWLCEEFLEPCIQGFGPCSISFGIVPEPLAGRSMPEFRPRPHKWVDRFGAACDACWHDQCAADVAPIDLAHAVDRCGLPYERLITYGGSEFMCLCAMHAAEPSYKLYENCRTGPGAHRFRTHGTSYADYRLRRIAKTPDSTQDWMRQPGERTHAAPLYAAHHQRVGRYFMLSDFCRSETDVAQGTMRFIGPLEPEARIAGLFAQVLDPIVAQVGRLCITQGGHWRAARQDDHSLDFLLPHGTAFGHIAFDHALVHKVVHKQHVSGAVAVRLTISDKEYEPNAGAS